MFVVLLRVLKVPAQTEIWGIYSSHNKQAWIVKFANSQIYNYYGSLKIINVDNLNVAKFVPLSLIDIIKIPHNVDPLLLVHVIPHEAELVPTRPGPIFVSGSKFCHQSM